MYIKVSIVLVLLVCLSITSSLKISNKILSNIVIGSSSLALLFSPIIRANADDNVLIGSYRDPAHTGCSRLISSSKGRLLISGSDHKNGAGKWAVQATSKDDGIVVDFTNGVVLQDWHSPSVDFPGWHQIPCYYISIIVITSTIPYYVQSIKERL